jgi:HAD superfamily hydrolase (TIGR01549 family)
VTRAIFFDVDFTLIYPGPTFQGGGYAQFCRKYGVDVDPARFPAAVAAASSILNDQQHVYDAEIFVRYTRRIIEEMGGAGPRLDDVAREVYAEWAACQHFFLYDDVAPVLRSLAQEGFKLGLISNSHRSLASFEEHFDLRGLIAGAVSSAEHGYMKPHPSIFDAALQLVGVSAGESVMVGDSLAHDIVGALGIGMGGVLVHRDETPHVESGVPVIRDLSELRSVL